MAAESMGECPLSREAASSADSWGERALFLAILEASSLAAKAAAAAALR